jgi:protein-tyrosine phosphatase
MPYSIETSYLASLKSKPTLEIEMVCLGNICRSPMAAAVLDNKSKSLARGTINVSSSGTSNYHIGEGPHRLSKKTWESAGYSYEHNASQFSSRSFAEKDLILTMDLTNRAMVLAAAKTDSDRQKVFLLRQFDPSLSEIDPLSTEAHILQVPDPWGEEIDSYQSVLTMIESAVDGLLNKVR